MKKCNAFLPIGVLKTGGKIPFDAYIKESSAFDFVAKKICAQSEFSFTEQTYDYFYVQPVEFLDKGLIAPPTHGILTWTWLLKDMATKKFSLCSSDEDLQPYRATLDFYIARRFLEWA